VDTDTQLDFGPMQINVGRAFRVGSEAGSIRVAKQWQSISNSIYLIESVPHAELAPLLARLPAQQARRSFDQERLKKLWANRSKEERGLPVSLSEVRSAQAAARKDTRVASGRRRQESSTPGVTLDWSLLSSATNFTFKGDTTYYVSGPVTLSSTTNGATVIEGGTVVKFTNSANAQIAISGPISCLTGPYRPAVFTSKDSNAEGEIITGSTDNPSGYYGLGILVYNNNTLHDLRFAYANTALSLASGLTLTIQDSQFVKCQNAFLFYSQTTANVKNGLFYQLDAWATGGQQSTTVNGCNLTVHNCNTLTSLGANSAVNLTNSLLVGVTDLSNSGPTLVSSINNDVIDPFAFVTVGAGGHYLQTSNVCGATIQLRNAGTTNISPALLARLSRKTTYAPAVLTKDFTTNTTRHQWSRAPTTAALISGFITTRLTTPGTA